MQVVQPLEVTVVTYDALLAAGPAPTEGHTVTIGPIFDVVLEAGGAVGQPGPAILSLRYDHTDWGALEGLIDQETRDLIEQQIRNLMSTTPMVLDLGALSGILGRPVGAVNAGIACGNDGTFATMRIELSVEGGDPPGWDWIRFFEDGPVDVRAGAAWAMLLDSRVLTGLLRDRMTNGLGAAPRFRLESGPTVSWNPPWGIHVSLSGEAIDACPALIDDLDLDADVDADISFSVPVTDTLRSHLHFDARPGDTLEEVYCAVTAGLLWPFVGAVLVSEDEVSAMQYLLGMIGGPVGVAIKGMVVLENQPDQRIQPPGAVGGGACRKLDDGIFDCDAPLALSFQGLRVVFEAARADTRGLVVSGSAPLRPLPPGEVTIVVEPFTWSVEGRSQDGFSVRQSGKVTVLVTEPDSVCVVTVVDDPLREFFVEEIPDGYRVRSARGFDFAAAPYPALVKMVSSRGVRIVNVGMPQPIGDAQAASLEQERWAGSLRARASTHRSSPVSIWPTGSSTRRTSSIYVCGRRWRPASSRVTYWWSPTSPARA